MRNMARAMWKHCLEIPSDCFKTLFDRVYKETDDLIALWQLGGATNDHLRKHPKALTVPIELPIRLLRSHHVDARIIGLKLLNRCPVEDGLIVEAIIRALRRRDGYESGGGVMELTRLLERHQRAGSTIEVNLASRLMHELDLLLHDINEPISQLERPWAQSLIEWLGEHRGRRTIEP